MNAIVTINNEDTLFFKRFSNKVFQISHWKYFQNKEEVGIVQRLGNRLLFIGRTNDKNKGFDYLRYLPKDKYDIQIVGDYIKTDRTDFHFNYNITDKQLIELYKSSSALLIPSRYEAFSYVALEALSFGTKILISDRVRIADYLPNGSYIVFKYGNIRSFINSVDKIKDSSINADNILEKFEPIYAYEKYKRMYTSLMK